MFYYKIPKKTGDQMWLTKVLTENNIKIGVNVSFAFVEQYASLPTSGKMGFIYIVKDVGEKYIWNNKKEEYNLIII